MGVAMLARVVAAGAAVFAAVVSDVDSGGEVRMT
jgi:hypothetical protein